MKSFLEYITEDFEYKGKHYSAHFGRYTCDGEPLDDDKERAKKKYFEIKALLDKESKSSIKSTKNSKSEVTISADKENETSNEDLVKRFETAIKSTTYEKAIENSYDIPKENKKGISAFREYSERAYRNINEYLTKRSSFCMYKPTIKTMLKTFSEAEPTKEDMVLHRGVKACLWISDIFRKNNVGDVVNSDGFNSTSTDKEVAERFGEYQVNILAPKGSKVINLSEISDMGKKMGAGLKEDEFLLPPSKFKILRMDKETKTLDVMLDF